MYVSMDRRTTSTGRLLRLSLILLVAYFSQVYPYLHFHHSHTESESPIELSMHPIDVNLRHVTEQHDPDSNSQDEDSGHNQHHEFEQYVDWHMVRTHSSSVHSNIESAYISVGWGSAPISDASAGLCRIESTALLKAVSFDGIDSRGPPIIG